MSIGVEVGIFCIGTVFGYLLFYSVRHTKEFNVDLLSSAIAAVGGGTVIKLAGGTDGWLGPYGIGIGVGFLAYGVLAFALVGPPLARRRALPGETITPLSRALLGKPRE